MLAGHSIDCLESSTDELDVIALPDQKALTLVLEPQCGTVSRVPNQDLGSTSFESCLCLGRLLSDLEPLILPQASVR